MDTNSYKGAPSRATILAPAFTPGSRRRKQPYQARLRAFSSQSLVLDDPLQSLMHRTTRVVFALVTNVRRDPLQNLNMPSVLECPVLDRDSFLGPPRHRNLFLCSSDPLCFSLSSQTWEGIPLKMGTEKGFSVQRVTYLQHLGLKKAATVRCPSGIIHDLLLLFR